MKNTGYGGNTTLPIPNATFWARSERGARIREVAETNGISKAEARESVDAAEARERGL